MSTITIQHIAARADMGASIVDCLFDAMALAMNERRTVVLIHNSREYVCDPGKVLEQIVQQQPEKAT